MFLRAKCFVLILALIASSSLLPAAGPTSDADAQAIRSVIEAQLAAFSADDAEKAFSFASEGIRQTFATAEVFIAMVKLSYPVVYRPASVLFLDPEQRDDDVMQPVEMSDEDGVLWLALYRMQRQPDKSWRIGGCILKRLPGSTA